MLSHIAAENFAREIGSEDTPYEALMKEDYLYVQLGKTLDDNNFPFPANDEHEFMEWFTKLRGDENEKPRLQDSTNNHNYFHGYVYAVKEENVKKFEETILFTTMANGYSLSKYNMKSIREAQQEAQKKHFESLFTFE